MYVVDMRVAADMVRCALGRLERLVAHQPVLAILLLALPGRRCPSAHGTQAPLCQATAAAIQLHTLQVQKLTQPCWAGVEAVHRRVP
jgi:hypothetical protein